MNFKACGGWDDWKVPTMFFTGSLNHVIFCFSGTEACMLDR